MRVKVRNVHRAAQSTDENGRLLLRWRVQSRRSSNTFESKDWISKDRSWSGQYILLYERETIDPPAICILDGNCFGDSRRGCCDASGERNFSTIDCPSRDEQSACSAVVCRNSSSAQSDYRHAWRHFQSAHINVFEPDWIIQPAELDVCASRNSVHAITAHPGSTVRPLAQAKSASGTSSDRASSYCDHPPARRV